MAERLFSFESAKWIPIIGSQRKVFDTIRRGCRDGRGRSRCRPREARSTSPPAQHWPNLQDRWVTRNISVAQAFRSNLTGLYMETDDKAIHDGRTIHQDRSQRRFRMLVG